MNRETIVQIITAMRAVCMDLEKKPYPIEYETFAPKVLTASVEYFLMTPDFADRVLGKFAEE